MEIAEITKSARGLFDAHGNRAEVEAAQKAKQHADAGETALAETWNAIRMAIREIRGAHET